jgi:putative transposase
MPKKNKITLHSYQRKKLLKIVKTGHRKAREILYAHILLKSAQGWTDEQIAQAFDISPDTVQRTRARFVQSGLKAALQESPRPGAPRQLTTEQETQWVALACSKPPEGQARWTVRLLAEEAVKRRIVSGMAPETLRQVLKKTRSSPGNSKAGVGETSLQTTWPA